MAFNFGRITQATVQLVLDRLLVYAPYALQALVPFRALLAIMIGATAYWLVPQHWRKGALVVISLGVVLFGYERPMLLPVAIASVCGLVYLAVCKGAPRTPILIGIIALYGLAHLAFGLITFTPWLRFTGLTAEYVLPTIGLTSAFTFLRLIHFTVDYGADGQRSRGAGEHASALPFLGSQAPPPNLLTFLAWCLFFPTFVHLPLIRYQAWAAQFERLPPTLTPAFVKTGVRRIGQGVLKGVLLAVVFVTINPNDALLNPAGRPFVALFFAAIIAAITYYVGFSAYMDIGIGAASLFGIALPENFAPVLKMLRINRMRDFWRSWNITTTQWLNDYVYQPLGGWRKHPVRNTLLTMTACGLWHSVSLFGAAWGFGFGLLLLIEHGYNKLRIKRDWPEVPRPVRAALLLSGVALINLSLTPYGYTAQSARLLYPLYWLGVV